MDEITKYCQFLERKDKPTKAKSKARNSVSQAAVTQQNLNQ